jgi:hypothetical protein
LIPKQIIGLGLLQLPQSLLVIPRGDMNTTSLEIESCQREMITTLCKRVCPEIDQSCSRNLPLPSLSPK